MAFSEPEIRRWMEHALGLARAATERDEVPIGAVLVHEGKLLAEGSNEREATRRTSAHAEMVALESFNARTRAWRLPPGTSLFVTLEPCLMCTGALLWARLENVYYGCSDPRAAGLTPLSPLIEAGRFDHRFAVVQGGILAEQSSALMTEFFRGKRVKPNPAEPVSVRRAVEADALSIHEAHMRSIRENCAKDYTPEQIRAWGERPFDEQIRRESIRQDLIWVAERAGQVEGYAHLRLPHTEGGSAQLMALYVTKAVLGQGVGKRLITEMETAARAAGAAKMVLEGTRTAKAFYESRGYRVTGPMTDHPIRGVPVPSYPMEKVL